jgi:hypothetical protein
MGEFYSPITLRFKDGSFWLILATFQPKKSKKVNNIDITLGKSRQR